MQKNIRIGILTQPLHTNYGGLLQAFALQKILQKNFDLDSTTVNIQMNITKKSKFISFIKNLIKKLILRKKIDIIKLRPNKIEKEIIAKNTNDFIKQYIKVTNEIGRNNKNFLKKLNYNVYIIGSDQVWRPKYSPNIYSYFLDFLKNNSSVKKISYAASFGVDDWEYSLKQTKICKRLIKKFDAVSVREEAGVNLCKKYFDVNATKVLDPTLLLSKDDYLQLVEKKHTEEINEDFIMFYVLDPKLLKGEIVKELKNKLVGRFYKIMPLAFTKENKKNINECIYPPVENWLYGFYKAKYVVTDSFHGTAFSILFNKQFITLGNEERGMSRFISILKIFGLEKRLISNVNQLNSGILNDKIDYQRINKILEDEQIKSLNFLKKSLFNKK